MRKRTFGPLLAAALLVPLVAASAPAAPVAAGEAAGEAAAAPTAAPADGKGRKVILDVDMGELNDDAVTMFMLAKAPQVDFLGVTVVSGNTWVEEGTAYSLRQLELIDRTDVPVVMGAGEPLMPGRQERLTAENALYGKAPWAGAFDSKRPPAYDRLAKPPYGGYPKTKPKKDTAAADFIVEQVKRYPNQVTVFADGPATNLALAVRTHPEIVPLIKEVIYMGGAFDKPGNITPAAEFNWWFDPESARISLRTPFRKQTIVPDDAAQHVVYGKKQYDRIVAGRQTPIKKIFKDLQGPEFAKDPNATHLLWDAITAAVFLDPAVAKRTDVRYVDVDANFGADYGRSLGYHLDEFDAPNNPKGTRKAGIVLDVDAERFWDLYIRLLRTE
ncbi:nucleoside hydrolase [Streptomyces sp. NBC_00237]|uniref:nucleoside hydrolase n=1 Tax=Streptomyces sp. NBC_00237 TaxID=2975687 RepID=UPI0022530C15|nr:nucleoside hydrolase [Streptomyces sp. NBC_00237]MCX5203154.1 nucleoside hydrolase [Streptomyces sp. NBC_00237]